MAKFECRPHPYANMIGGSLYWGFETEIETRQDLLLFLLMFVICSKVQNNLGKDSSNFIKCLQKAQDTRITLSFSQFQLPFFK